MRGRTVAGTRKANAVGRSGHLGAITDISEARDLYARTRAHLDTEATLISSRTNWVFASNAFLFSAYAAVSDKRRLKPGVDPAAHLRGVVPFLGIALSLGSVVLIVAAIA